MANLINQSPRTVTIGLTELPEQCVYFRRFDRVFAKLWTAFSTTEPPLVLAVQVPPHGLQLTTVMQLVLLPEPTEDEIVYDSN